MPPGVLEKGILLRLRFDFHQYVNLRPVRLYPGRRDADQGQGARRHRPGRRPREQRGPLRRRRRVHPQGDARGGRDPDLDQHPGGRRALPPVRLRAGPGAGPGAAVPRALAPTTATRGQVGQVTLVAKTNVLTFAHDLWMRAFTEVSRDYPEIKTDYQHVDACCMRMVVSPERFDVIATTNMFGDIITDLGAVLQGGMGLAASGNLNPDRTAPSMFEPVHGSAPDIAGKGIANPIAAILSVGDDARPPGRPARGRADPPAPWPGSWPPGRPGPPTWEGTRPRPRSAAPSCEALELGDAGRGRRRGRRHERSTSATRDRPPDVSRSRPSILSRPTGRSRPSTSASRRDPPMSLGASHALDASVLVLNKFYMAVHVISVRRAFCLLFKDLAEVITLDDGRYLVVRLPELARGLRGPRPVQGARRRVHPHRPLRDPGPPGHPPPDLRPAAPAEGQVQPPEHLRPRRQPLPVLRQAVPHQRAEPRPRHAPQPGRAGDLGEHRLRLPQVQRPQGGPHPGEAGMRLIREPRSSPRPARPSASSSSHRKYQSWKTFLDNAYWSVELK